MTKRPSARLLTTQEAADRLGVTDETMRRWAKKGRIPHVITPSGRFLFDPDEVEQMYRRVEPTAVA